MSMSVLCYASAVLVALLHITLLGKHPLPTSPACNTLACQLCILHSLPPLQAAWILAIGVACRFALQRRRYLGASIAAVLASLLATPIACEPDQCVFFIPCHLCKQCELWGMALLAGLHCSVGVVWVGKHCCQVGIMAQALPLLVCIALAKHCLVANLWCMLLIGHCCANCSCKLVPASLPSLLVACLHDSGDMLHAQCVGCW